MHIKSDIKSFMLRWTVIGRTFTLYHRTSLGIKGLPLILTRLSGYIILSEVRKSGWNQTLFVVISKIQNFLYAAGILIHEK